MFLLAHVAFLRHQRQGLSFEQRERAAASTGGDERGYDLYNDMQQSDRYGFLPPFPHPSLPGAKQVYPNT
jgi:hypothetical protein